jgi:hypothetical protein
VNLGDLRRRRRRRRAHRLLGALDPVRRAPARRDERAEHVRELRATLAGEPEPVRALGSGDGELRGGVEKRVRRLGVVVFLQQRRQAVRVARERHQHRLRGGEKQLDARRVQVCDGVFRTVLRGARRKREGR